MQNEKELVPLMHYGVLQGWIDLHDVQCVIPLRPSISEIVMRSGDRFTVDCPHHQVSSAVQEGCHPLRSIEHIGGMEREAEQTA